jgi:Rad3-related DNA helicase
MHLWCRLLPQAKFTCNLLCPANANPNVSAYQYVYGAFDYKRTPLHPPGCAVQAFNSLSTRKLWEEHSKDAWHHRRSTKHYRTYQEYIKATRAVQNCDTVFFKHHYITKPKVTKADVVTNAANNLIDAIKGNLSSTQDHSDMEALDRLAQIFLEASKKVSNGHVEEEVDPPRVEETSPRVAEPGMTKTPRPRDRVEPMMPNLIPDYDSDSDEEEEVESIPRYNTRAQAMTQKIKKEASRGKQCYRQSR